jgi:hypothetical protein
MENLGFDPFSATTLILLRTLSVSETFSKSSIDAPQPGVSAEKRLTA